MPSLTLPPGVPLGLWWYLIWISVNGIFIHIFKLLRGSNGKLQADAKEESEKYLPALNEYLWRLVNESSSDRYEGPLSSADDLSKLSLRVRDANRPLIIHNRLYHHTGFGILAASCAILGIIISGIIYLLEYPSIEVASLISIMGCSVLTLWSLWHMANSLYYNYKLLRYKYEED